MADVVLMYHNIAEHGQCILFNEWSSAYDIGYATFQQHLKLTEKHRNNVVLTFDDGYQSVHKFVLPLLEMSPSVCCKCFITTGAIGQDGMLTKKEIRELAKNNFHIGAHTQTHLFLEKLSKHQFEQEILQPKLILEEITGTEITEMSLPGGRYDSRSLEFTAKCGYKKIYTSRPGTKAQYLTKLPDIQLIPRWVITSGTTVADLERMMNLDSWYVSLRKLQFGAGKFAKRLLGNRGYHTFWRAVHTNN
ncbi:MAG: polysaccharide deacetylase family protein [bacterium]